MKRRWIVLAALIILALIIGVYIARRERKPTKLRVGFIPIADAGQLFVAIDKGFFNEEGIEVETVSLPGGAQILEALGANSIDIGFSNIVSLILARDSGLQFVALTGGPAEDEAHKEHAILVRRDGPVQQVTDLSGKRIALNSRKNIDELMLTLLFKKHNINPSSVTFVEVPFPRMLNVLESGDVQAVAAIEPFVTFGLKDQKNKVLTYNYLEIQPVTEISTYVANKNWVNGNPELAGAFQRALRKATVFAQANQAEVKRILTRYTRLDENQIKDVILPSYNESLSDERLNEMIKRVHEMGWIKNTFPAQDIKNSAK